MTSVQERLQLKRVPLDKWSSKEQLCLASAVAFSGDQNWMSVSRSLKMICGDSNRPNDWFSQKFCAIEYGKLLENVETPKRKKRTASERDAAIPDTPGESIVRKLTQERIEELQKIIEEEKQEFAKIRDEVLLLQSGDADDAVVQEMWEQVELEKKQLELQQQHREKWMREREERKLEMERAWRPSLAYQQQSGLSPKAGGSQIKIKPEQSDMMDIEELSPQKHGTSPLLTSLLKSPSPAPGTLQSATGSPSSRSATTAPTITSLLTSGTNISQLSFDEPPQYQTVQHLFPEASTSTVQSAASQAPTLTKLLDSRTTAIPAQMATTSTYAEQPYSGSMLLKEPFSMENETDDNSDGKDEENLMEVFKNLIPDDLADILADNNEMILNPELLDEEKLLVESLMNEAEGLPMDDVDDEICKAEREDDVLKEEKEPSQQVDEVLMQEEGKEEVEQQQAEAVDSVVVIDDDSPPGTDNPISVETGSDTDQLNEIDNNLVLEILSDDEEKSANAEESTKPEVTPELEAATAAPSVPVQDKHEPESEISQEAVQQISDESNETHSPKGEEQQPTELPEPQIKEPDTAESESVKEVEVQKEQVDVVEPSEEKPSLSEEPEQLPTTEPKDEVVTIEDNENEDEDVKIIEEEPLPGIDVEEVTEKVTEQSESDKNTSPPPKEEAEEEVKETLLTEVKIKEEIIEQAEEKLKHDAEAEVPDKKIDSDEETFEDAKDTVEDIIMETETEDVKPLALQEGYSATIIDTDDDSPIEVIKEDKIGKTKRDYSRKKPEVVITDILKSSDEHRHLSHKHRHTDDDGGSSKTVGFNTRMKAKEQRDGSESPMVDDDQSSDNAPPRTRRRHSSTPIIESIPSSPASSDDREYRLWKKSILMVYNRLSTHKFASAFLRVNTDENYKNTILRPMDLHTIKKNVENGSIRSTSEFFSNIMLMCQNAIMYYKKDNSVYSMAKELMAESISLMETTPETVKSKDSSEKTTTPSTSTATALASGSSSQSSVVASAASSSISSPIIKRAGRKSQRLPQN